MKMEYRYAGMDILYQLVLIRTETVREKGALKSVRKPAYDAVQTMDQFGFRRRAAAALSKDQKIPVQISGISAGTLDQAFGRQFAVGNGRGPHIGSGQTAQQGKLASAVINGHRTAGKRGIGGIALDDFKRASQIQIGQAGSACQRMIRSH